MMATAKNSNDVFEMAMGMERIGKDFSDALAVARDDARVRDFCARAAGDEAGHLAAFRQMRDEWARSAKSSRVPPEAAEALAALAKSHIQPDPAAVKKVAIRGSLKDALAMAMQMEQDSINFYRELLAPLPISAKVIRGIMAEEEKHLRRLRALGG
jgi:rubrerythrin